jgi:hypoxanthine-DNA glycosylase
VQRLTEAGIAVWDVIASCRREGSLDSAIRDETVNDFDGFLAAHPRVRTVLFNGAKAEASFVRRVLPTLPPTTLHSQRLANRSHEDRSLENRPA